MNKSIPMIILGFIICASIFTASGFSTNRIQQPISFDKQKNCLKQGPFDLLYDYDIGATGETGANGNFGAECDGTYLYSTRWASALIHRYNKNGDLVEEFSILGVSGLRDLTYDGTQYMYGGAGGGTIWKMDFITKTLVNTITGSFQARAIAYDTDLDILYVANWGDTVWKIDALSGAAIGVFNLGMTITPSGFAYDPSGPYLWVFDQGSGAVIYQWDLDAGAMTGYTYDVNNDVGSGDGTAGGLWAGFLYEKALFVLGGCLQDSSTGGTDWLFGYELWGYIPSNPYTPSEPSGPTIGTIGVSYTFTGVTTDPQGEDLFYKFNWGDGNYSAWVGPVASGTPQSASYTYNAPGTYTVKVKAKDVNGGESDWSAGHDIAIADAPAPVVEWIKGGLFFVTASVKNAGGVAATNVAYTISLAGGAFIGKETTGTIASLDPGASETIKSKFILGFGATVITVTADTSTKTADGKILLFFIKIK
ncbi:MAG: PKD domain-containing protein [Candidatus Thermoplasmatota archaeon]|nr:PKD domain-containing protein [Candidatus Thermoplasmatota archaeon]